MLVNKLQASRGIKYFYLNLSLILLQDKNESFVQHSLGIKLMNLTYLSKIWQNCGYLTHFLICEFLEYYITHRLKATRKYGFILTLRKNSRLFQTT